MKNIRINFFEPNSSRRTRLMDWAESWENGCIRDLDIFGLNYEILGLIKRIEFSKIHISDFVFFDSYLLNFSTSIFSNFNPSSA